MLLGAPQMGVPNVRRVLNEMKRKAAGSGSRGHDRLCCLRPDAHMGRLQGTLQALLLKEIDRVIDAHQDPIKSVLDSHHNSITRGYAFCD